MSDGQWIFISVILFIVFGYVVPYLQYKNSNPPKPSKSVKRPMPIEPPTIVDIYTKDITKDIKEGLKVFYMEEN